MTIDVLAVIYAPLEKYPPSLNQVALFAEAGLRVAVIDCFHPRITLFSFSGHYPVRRIRGAHYTEQHRERLPRGAVRFWRLCEFKAKLERCIRQLNPKIVIAYDTYAMFLLGAMRSREPRPLVVWHFHELPAAASGRRIGGVVGFAERAILSNAHKVDVWMVADSGRAQILSNTLSAPRAQFVVMNCPRRLEQLPNGQLRRRLRDLTFTSRRIVLFQGALDISRCVETMIKSVKRWPLDAGLVFLGPVEKAYKETLLHCAKTEGYERRIIFLDPVPYEEIFSYTVDADVACCLVRGGGDKNWEFSAGAVNKRFEYMAAGVPQVTNHGPGLTEIIHDTQCGLLVAHDSPEEVGDAIAHLLENHALRQQMAMNARRAHLASYNYEAQLKGPLDLFLSWIAEDDTKLRQRHLTAG